jgi:hypothetical protein
MSRNGPPPLEAKSESGRLGFRLRLWVCSVMLTTPWKLRALASEGSMLSSTGKPTGRPTEAGRRCSTASSGGTERTATSSAPGLRPTTCSKPIERSAPRPPGRANAPLAWLPAMVSETGVSAESLAAGSDKVMHSGTTSLPSA